MDDLLGVEVEYSISNLASPADHLWREDLLRRPDVVVEVALGAELHHHTETGGLCAHTPGERGGGGGGGRRGKKGKKKTKGTALQSVVHLQVSVCIKPTSSTSIQPQIHSQTTTS